MISDTASVTLLHVPVVKSIVAFNQTFLHVLKCSPLLISYQAIQNGIQIILHVHICLNARKLPPLL